MNDTTPKGSLAGADRRDKRALVLSEAVQQFNSVGYYDTRLEDVAEKLGTAKTSISYHFKSKESLLFEAYSNTCAFAEQRLKLAADEKNGLERALSLLKSFAMAHSAAIIGRAAPLAVISDIEALNPPEDDRITRRVAQYSAGLRQFLKDGLEDGSVSSRQPESATFLLLSLQHWVQRWLQNVVPAQHENAIDTLIDMLRYGLAEDRDEDLRTAPAEMQTDTQNFLFDRQARNRMKLEAFLRIGTRHFNLKGFRHLSVNDICAELGVSRGVFYYHFDDKDALLKSCATRSLDLMEDSLQRGRARGRNALEQLHMALTSLLEGHFNDVNPLLRQALYASLSPKERPVIQARARRVTAGFGELIAQGVSDGSIRPIDLDAIEHLVCGAVFGATRHRFRLFALGDDESRATQSFDVREYFRPLMFGLAERP